MATATLPAEVSAALDEVKKGLGEQFASKTDLQSIQNDANAKHAETQKALGEIKAHITVGEDRRNEDPAWGFKHFGEFAGAVKRHVIDKVTDERFKVIKAPSTYANEAVGADGGFLVPPQFEKTLLRHVNSEASLLPRTRRIVTSGNSVTIPKDETVPWGSDGVQAYWAGENSTITASKPKFGEINMTLHKLTVLVPVTSEMLDDAFLGVGQYLGQVAPEKITSKVNTALVNGTGAGQPLGYRRSAALITQAKESGQTADTINATNVLKMYSRLQKGGSPVWLHSPTAIPQLGTMTIGQQPVWLPNASLESGTPGRLLGISTIECPDSAAVGDVGDIELVDLSKYITITKSTGIRSDMSMHLYFDSDALAYRFIFRLGGAPWQQAPITLKDGSTTQSPFVTLAERA